ncbi:helix-turn-helix transcriptional regulator [Streptomyces sp. NPDC001027]|uniref:helix-turn-helix domain-containing protein n=1 Tax=Streptomyces sp. NPDC001027 TaxID=3154771 RepID=UPI00332B9ED5
MAANLRRIRNARGLSTTKLAVLLKDAGQSIPATGITRIEKGERRVDVDDLMALAIALGVSPSALLLPPTDSPEQTVDITGGGSVPSDTAWAWLDGTRPLRLSESNAYAATLEYALYSRPPWMRPGGSHIAGAHTQQATVATQLANVISALVADPEALQKFLDERK